jgi:hypothetical protein
MANVVINGKMDMDKYVKLLQSHVDEKTEELKQWLARPKSEHETFEGEIEDAVQALSMALYGLGRGKELRDKELKQENGKKSVEVKPSINRSDVFKEKYAVNLCLNGDYNTYLKVLYINEPEKEISFWIYIRVYGYGRPTKHGIRFTAKEFEEYLNRFADITTTKQTVIKKILKPPRDWQIYPDPSKEDVWPIELRQANGKITEIPLHWREHNHIFTLRNQIIDECQLDIKEIANM